MRSKLPEIRRKPTVMDEETRDRDWAAKLAGKQYADDRRRAMKSDIKVGDSVLIGQPKTDKLSSTYAPVPCQVITQDNSEVKVMDESGKLKTCNVSFMKRYYEDKRDGEEVTADTDTAAVESQPKSDTKRVTPETVTRPIHERRSPAYLKGLYLFICIL